LERKKMQLRSYFTKLFIAGWISNETFARGSNSRFFLFACIWSLINKTAHVKSRGLREVAS
jgi:hypothetical protein